MPRVVKREKKIRWTEDFESGNSVAEIRASEKDQPDPRTIRRGIDEIQAIRRRERARQVALQEGLREHWDRLLKILDRLPGNLFDWQVFSKDPVFALDADVLIGQGWAAHSSDDGWSVTLDIEDELEYSLLKEHLPNDRIWTLVATFKKNLTAILAARLDLAQAVVGKVESASGLELDDVNLRKVGVSALDLQVAERILSRSDRKLDITEKDGSVWIDDRQLLQGRVSEIPPFAELVEVALTELEMSDHRKKLIGDSAALNRSHRRLVEETKILKLSTVLPGDCRACTRFSA